MYERFTDRARKVMQLAHQEAQHFNHEYIGTEHVLLGLVAEGAGVAANVLKNLNIDVRKIRHEVEKIVCPKPDGEPHIADNDPQTPRKRRAGWFSWLSPTPRLPHTLRTIKAIEYAIDEAERLKHNYVGTEHLLLGLLREQEGVAHQILIKIGVQLEDVREEILNLLGHSMPMTAVADPFVVVRATASGTPPDHLTHSELQTVRERIRVLSEQKEAAVLEQDIDLAARCREEEKVLTQLLVWYEWYKDRA